MERWSLFSPLDLRRYMVRINVSNILHAYLSVYGGFADNLHDVVGL